MVSTGIALLCCGIAVLFFGSNFVPVKTVETGDGVFFSFVLCTGIFFVGIIINAVEGFPEFEPWAMLGGAIWCTGNLMSVPTIKLIGLSLGMLLWGTTNMLVGWATGRFGLFGVNPQLACDPEDANQAESSCIHDVGLNYVGMILACISLVIYVFVEPEDMEKHQTSSRESDSDRLLDHVRNEDYMSFMPTPRIISNQPFREVVNQVPSFHEDLDKLADVEGNIIRPTAVGKIDRLSKASKRLLGILLACTSGLFYGSNLTPPQVEHDHGGDQNLMHYIFSHFCGIQFTMTLYFIAYCIYNGEKAAIYPKAIVPGFFSGVMWAVAQVSWFIANGALGFAVSFPIIACGPGLVASLWGIFVFGEIRGTRNYIVISIAGLFTVCSGVIIGLSK